MQEPAHFSNSTSTLPSCVDVDSVHNDYQRHVPYAVFYPDLIKNTMETGWSKLQQSNGMIVESLSGGCMGATGTLDGGGGRVMGDVSTIFIIEALEMFEYTHDVEWLTRIYPTITRAIDWFVDVGTDGSALPKRQCCTYDIIDFADYDHTSFNSFVYLAALRACVRLANIQNDSTLATKCNTAYAAGEVAINASLWNATSGYYRAWTDASLGAPPWVMADTLYVFHASTVTHPLLLRAPVRLHFRPPSKQPVKIPTRYSINTIICAHISRHGLYLFQRFAGMAK